jgi:RimJ/RimL family protein N-acetyltransferase
MHLVRTGSPLSDRVILASTSDIALAELLDGEKAAVDAVCETTFDEDPDDRPLLLELPEWRVAILDVPSGELLGTMVWRAVSYGDKRSATAWNIGIRLVPTARGRSLSAAAGLLLAQHLFATTMVDRVEANTDVDNRPGQRGLEKAGFHREGITRGVQLRNGQRHDMVLYSLLRSDLAASGEAAGERAILAHRDGVVLAEALPTDRDTVSDASDNAFAVDPDPRPSLLPPPTVHRAAILDADSYDLLGAISWHPVGYGGTFACTAWNIGIELVVAARGRGIGTTAQRLLAEHLFATTEIDRVEAGTDIDNLAEQRALEKAGFHRDGVVRGAQLRDGQRRDMVVYGLLRSDLEPK